MAPLFNVAPVKGITAALTSDAAAEASRETQRVRRSKAQELDVADMLKLVAYILKVFRKADRVAQTKRRASRQMSLWLSPSISVALLVASVLAAAIMWARARTFNDTCMRRCLRSPDGPACDAETRALVSAGVEIHQACAMTATVLVFGMGLWRWLLFASLFGPLRFVSSVVTAVVRAVSQMQCMGDMAPFVVVGIQARLSRTVRMLLWLALWFAVAASPLDRANASHRWNSETARSVWPDTFLDVHFVVWRSLLMVATAEFAGLLASVAGRVLSMVFHHKNHFRQMQLALLNEHIVRMLTRPRYVMDATILHVRGRRFDLKGFEAAHWCALLYVTRVLRMWRLDDEKTRSLAMNVQKRLALAIVARQETDGGLASVAGGIGGTAASPTANEAAAAASRRSVSLGRPENAQKDGASVQSEVTLGPMAELVIEEARVRCELATLVVDSNVHPTWWNPEQVAPSRDSFECSSESSLSQYVNELPQPSVDANDGGNVRDTAKRRDKKIAKLSGIITSNPPLIVADDVAGARAVDASLPAAATTAVDLSRLLAHAHRGLGLDRSSVETTETKVEPNIESKRVASGTLSLSSSTSDYHAGSGPHLSVNASSSSSSPENGKCDPDEASPSSTASSTLATASMGVDRRVPRTRTTDDECAAIDALMRERWRQNAERARLPVSCDASSWKQISLSWSYLRFRASVFARRVRRSVSRRWPQTRRMVGAITTKRVMGSVFAVHEFLSHERTMRVSPSAPDSGDKSGSGGGGGGSVSVESLADAWMLGYYLFWNLKRPGSIRPNLKRRDVDLASDTLGLVQKGAAWSLLDRNSDDTASMIEIVTSVESVYRNRKLLAKLLIDSQSIVGQVQTVIHAVLLVGVALVTVAVLLRDGLGRFWTGVSAAFIGLSFVFGNSVHQLLENCIFLLLSHPFDLGDAVRIDGRQYTVVGLRIQYVTLSHTSGNVVHVATSDLTRARITNLSRSNGEWDTISFAVTDDATTDACEVVADAVVDALQANTRLFAGHYRLWLEGSESRDGLVLSLHYDQATAGDDLCVAGEARTVMTQAVLRGVRAAGIHR